MSATPRATITIETFKLEHIQQMKLREHDAVSIEYVKTLEDAAAIFLRGPAWTVRINGEIGGAGGFVSPWPGLAEGWILTTPLILRFPKVAYTLARRFLEMARKDMGFARIEATAPIAYTVAHRWLESLGFEKESIMYSYGPNGEDFVKYRILCEGRPHVA